MPNAWDRPPWPTIGSRKANVIFEAVGRSLSSWCDVEQSISDLFIFFVGPGAINSPAIRAYSSIDGVRNRIRMVRHSAYAWFERFEGCPLEASTLEVLKACEGWSSRRNDIAHGGVDIPLDEGETPSWYLYPAYFTVKRPITGKPDFRYSAEQVDAIATAFDALDVTLTELRGNLEDWREDHS